MTEPEPEQAKLETFTSFAYLLSPLVLRSLADLGFSLPIRVEQQAIPLALETAMSLLVPLQGAARPLHTAYHPEAPQCQGCRYASRGIVIPSTSVLLLFSGSLFVW